MARMLRRDSARSRSAMAIRAAPVRPRARRRIGAPGQVLYAKLRRGGVVGVAGNAHDDNVFRFRTVHGGT
jgi:hypothetical protein